MDWIKVGDKAWLSKCGHTLSSSPPQEEEEEDTIFFEARQRPIWIERKMNDCSICEEEKYLTGERERTIKTDWNDSVTAPWTSKPKPISIWDHPDILKKISNGKW